jgi:L-arabinose isomerase
MSKHLDFQQLEFWFLTGSQHLYGPVALEQVAADARKVVDGLNDSGTLPHRVVFKPVLTTPDEVTRLCLEANSTTGCAGVVAWMHTFSPAKMWIAGLQSLRKPLADLHTQFGRDLPWSTIDMEFMNLHQTAHGGREFGHLGARLRLPRKVIVGHWQDPVVCGSLAAWMRVARGWHASQQLKIARFGDNMRQVAVTEGDKVSAQIRFGWAVNGYGVGDLVECVNAATDREVDALCSEYEDIYRLAPELEPTGSRYGSLRDAARIELGLRSFLEDGGFHGFTTTFEDLHGLRQLPGLAVQRLMADGFGFGAEGDWKTAALLRVMKVMAAGLPGGTSFMEDYTYHLDPAGRHILGAHMLEVCPSIAAATPSLEIHRLGIGGREDPCRLVFDSRAGTAVNATLVDLGNRFRMIVNEVECMATPQPLPKLPVARALWNPQPDFQTATAAWIHAGGAHHTVLSHPLTSTDLADFAEIAGVECLVIDAATTLQSCKDALRWNDLAYHLSQGIHG